MSFAEQHARQEQSKPGIAGHKAAAALQIYVAKHATNKKEKWVSGNLLFFRMNRISDIYFVGGFGTVQWVDVADYMATTPDSIVAVNPQQTITVSFILPCPVLDAAVNMTEMNILC